MRKAISSVWLAWLCSIAAANGQQEEAVTVFQATSASVVRLHNVANTGTGVVLNRQGVILTNAHVISSPLSFKCTVDVMKGSERQTVVFERVEIVKVHKSLDLALVKINPDDLGVQLTPCKVNKQKAVTGQRIYAIGNPRTESDVELTKTITEGLLSGVDRVIDDAKYYQISASINPGNSGGPLCDREGDVIGIVTLKFADADNVGFAIPLHDIKIEDFVVFHRKSIDPQRALVLLKRAEPLIDNAAKLSRIEGGRESLSAAFNRALAMQFCAEAAYFDPNNYKVLQSIGAIYFNAREYDAAEAYLFESIRLEPWASSRSYEILYKTLMVLEREEDARVVLEESMAKYPQLGLFWIGMGLHLLKKNKHEEGIRYLSAGEQLCEVANDQVSLGPGLRVLQACRMRFGDDEMERLTISRDAILSHTQKRDAEVRADYASGYQALTAEFADWMKEKTEANLRVSKRLFTFLP